ncbi:mitochondrial acyl carrier protein [Aspergillus fumigatus]
MFRSAVVRSLRASVPRAVRTPAAFQIRSSPVARPAQFAPRFAYQGVRLYSAPAGLNKEEVEGRIVNLLKNFDKVSDASKVRGHRLCQLMQWAGYPFHLQTFKKAMICHMDKV